MEKTTLYLPVDLQRLLKDTSHRTGKPQAELVREALAAFLEKQPRPRPRSIGVVADSSASGEQSEDWLRENWTPDPG